jgi:hypothetical protein
MAYANNEGRGIFRYLGVGGISATLGWVEFSLAFYHSSADPVLYE